MTQNTLTVSELTFAIKNVLEPRFCNVAVQGEVSNFKRQSSGHLYFSLKDADSQVSAVMFAGQASKLKTLPKEGDQVVVKGDLNVYPPRGNYQIVVRDLSLAGVGALLLKLEELKREINRRGWFSKEHKKPLPPLPKKIGIVTSPTGAAIRDMLNVLDRRFAGLHILLNPVKVQGEGAAEEIAKAIEQFNRHKLVDVIIVGRGGGSIEDLWAFNEETLASAIFHSDIPIIGAVGHETDHTIAEYVADVRAPTPSAAAELVTREKIQLQKHLDQLQLRIIQTIRHLIHQNKSIIEGFIRQPAFSSPYHLLGVWMQKLDDLQSQLQRAPRQLILQKQLQLKSIGRELSALNPKTQILHVKQKILALEQSIIRSQENLIAQSKNKLQSLRETFLAIDPKKLLKRGYSIVFNEKDKSVITSVKSLRKHQIVRMLLSDGEALAEVEDTFYDKETR